MSIRRARKWWQPAKQKQARYKDVRRLNVVISTYATLIEAMSLNFDKKTSIQTHRICKAARKKNSLRTSK